MDEDKSYLVEEDELYRIVINSERDRKNKAIPAIRCFGLSKLDDNKLSVDCVKLTTPEKSIARVGATYRHGVEPPEYKEYKNRELYKMNVSFISVLPCIKQIYLDPIAYAKGCPENPSHSLVEFGDISTSEYPETLLKMRDYAKEHLINLDMNVIDRLVTELRQKDLF